MGVVAGLLLGAGLCCVWWAWTAPPPRGRDRAWSQRTQDLLVHAGAPGVTPARLVATCAGAGLAALLLGLVLTRVSAVGAVAGAAGVAAPVVVVRGRAARHRRRLRDSWPDAVDHLTSGIRAGLSLPEALAQLGERGPVPLRAAFAAFGEDYRASGRFDDCLDRLQARLADPVADRIVASLRLTRDVGGSDLGRLLRALSVFLREDARTRNELEARQGWTVVAARLAVAAPWVVLALLATRPEARAAYATATGSVVVASGAVSSVLAYLLMLRLGRLDDDPRVLR